MFFVVKCSVLPDYINMRYRTEKGAHSVYSLQFHYVACVKYRKKVFSDNISSRLKEINLSVAE
ncbi:transposase, partial [Malonomonas rubra]|uniref:transposase n=1 Tax=Malonomonas rubra TaxID=57040 RepID=UPI0034E97B21